MDYFKYLPLEITLDILTRLPTESVLDCKLVCHTWRSVVRHPSFSKIHFGHSVDSGKLGFLASAKNSDNENCFYYFKYYENHRSITPLVQRIRKISSTPPIKCFKFVGSCNGLICLVQDRSICICNPITKEYVMLPEIKGDCDVDECYYCTTGFGYVSSTNDYKVIRIIIYESKPEVHVYTLGSSNGWKNLRNLGTFNSQMFNVENWDEASTFANGALYWLDEDLETIVTFDLAEEKFGEHLSLPHLRQRPIWVDYRIGVLDGFLFFAIRLDAKVNEYYDIWLLKKKNNYHEKKKQEEHQSLGWYKEFRIGKDKLLAFTKSDGVLLYGRQYLSIYDTKTATLQKLVEFKNCLLEVYPHENTLVSLKEFGGKDAKVMESAKIEEL